MDVVAADREIDQKMQQQQKGGGEKLGHHETSGIALYKTVRSGEKIKETSASVVGEKNYPPAAVAEGVRTRVRVRACTLTHDEIQKNDK
ncbi:unnamed protein product [Schistocephalus solidus]|uniref:Uncharacterized protein n=1 Tax=Schistocephalus solidus TaxID=70667 RepID=A0A183SUB2_SCHSO|nr:unnamed protein product [Schistocephalus solidus]